ncbi:hypothetical protein M9194_05760 [Vibrio sp. S4M6]|uniref:hypothetical protein n=1 Tax=Vibrio sinus TaxID=2946865 RepID=UPI00202A4D44|nr:hypothetical protein [Vibrio sinus]MCL9780936.1 hypothetical protein [Vibrio sinus]
MTKKLCLLFISIGLVVPGMSYADTVMIPLPPGVPLPPPRQAITSLEHAEKVERSKSKQGSSMNSVFYIEKTITDNSKNTTTDIYKDGSKVVYKAGKVVQMVQPNGMTTLFLGDGSIKVIHPDGRLVTYQNSAESASAG